MINLDRLNAFIHVADSLSFTKTAQYLHVSQPTVSKYIRDLEHELGVQLIDRHSAKLQLTNEGITLLPHARKLIRNSTEVHKLMTSLQSGIIGQLQIACSTSAGKYILPLLAARFQQRYPDIQIKILTCTQEHVAPQLLEGEAQLGVVSREICGSGIECQEFFEDIISLIVPSDHRWASRTTVEPDELLGEPLIIREPTAGTRRVMLEMLAEHDITLDDLSIFLELGNAEAIVETVAAGFGVSFVSRIAAIRPLDQGAISEVKIRDITLQRRLNMVRRELEPTGFSNRTRDAFWSFVHDPTNEDLYYLA